MNAEDIKVRQMLDLENECIKNDVDFNSMSKLLNSEKVKRISKRVQYLQQTINSEIEKSIDHENK
jgi:hypothetical protein